MATVAPNSILTLLEARAYLKRPEDGDDDEPIADFIDYVNGAIAVYTKRKLMSRTYSGAAFDPASGQEPTMIVSGRGSREIALREYPVTSVTEVLERYEDGAQTRTLSISGLRIINGGRRIFLPFDSFASGQSNIEIKCVAGYSLAAHPNETRALKIAALRYLQVLWQDYELALGRGQALSVGGESVSVIPDSLPKDIAMMLRPFERWL